MDLHKLLFEESSRTKAKKKIRELERKIEEYNKLSDDYQLNIDENYKAKTYAYNICKEVKAYIDSLTNITKEIDSIILSQTYNVENFDNYADDEKKAMKKNLRKNARNSLISIIPLIGIPMWFHEPKREDKANNEIIDKCNQKIRTINREINKIKSRSNEIITEYEFLITYADNLKISMQRLKNTGLQNYLEFSTKEKGELGALVNSLQALISRIGAK